MEHKNMIPISKTTMPNWGGALLIIAGLLNIGAGIGITVAIEAIEDFFDFTGAIFAGTPMIVIGVITAIGGIVALMRRVWWLAIIGGILGVLPSPGWLFGVPGLILVSISKKEFDYREVLTEERVGMMEPTGRPAVNTATMHTYLRGLNYPADKSMITNVARSNAAPDAVMMYMNRLPDRAYMNSAEIDEEFSKIR